ncbi:tetratricopeptide repeat protein [Flocculibacter collagenilyticus]|uniref:tetratricopeptide repeat protein n=1 Tax=Flocculibacter collagenilyticus TaxID=2744479 RepID=UPI0018F53687|nr:tetratricopeptide repeat protein [Flocculibacter collagenilyticus]
MGEVSRLASRLIANSAVFTTFNTLTHSDLTRTSRCRNHNALASTSLTIKVPLIATILLSMVLLSGCKSTFENKYIYESTPDALMADEQFPTAATIDIESEAEVFYLPPQAIELVQRSLLHVDHPLDRTRKLIKLIFNNTNLNLIYNNTANYTAAQTFKHQAANCLSLSIMTYSMAQAANLHVQFQEIKIPEFWTHVKGHTLLNGHININITGQDDGETVYSSIAGYELDFDPFSPKKRFPKADIDKTRVLAMFYNNKGADALIAQQHDIAYAYFKKAVTTDPNFSSAFTNLGLLYRRSDLNEKAETVYKHALSIKEANNTAWHNLAILYRKLDQHVEADEITQRLESIRLSNPFYHYTLGNEAISQQRYSDAIKHFKRAISMDKTEHEFYFGLAKVYYFLDDLDKSERYLKLAKHHSDTHVIATNYQSKLNHLRATQ